MASEKHNPKNENGDAEQQGSAGPLRRALGWIAAHRLAVGLLVGGCILTASIAAGGLWFWLGAAEDDGTATLAAAFDAYDGGYIQEARRLAELLIENHMSSSETLGGAGFILGAIAYHETEDSLQADKRTDYLRAARYLEEAGDRGIPSDRKAEGLLLLGCSLYLSGQASASRAVLLDALRNAESEEKQIELKRMLADAYLAEPLAKLGDALKFNERLLAHKSLSPHERGAAMLQRAKIFLRMDRRDDCLATLKEMPEGARHRAEAGVVKGRLLMREAELIQAAAAKEGKTDVESSDAKQKYEAAIDCFRAAQGSDTLNNSATREAMYLSGACYQQLQNYRAAAERLGRLQMLFPDTPEAAAADLRQAELARRFGRNEAALTAYRRLAKAADDPAAAHNPWYTADEARRSLLAAHQHYLETQNFEISLQLAKNSHPLIPKEQAIALVADTYRVWGDGLLARATHMPPAGAAAARHNGRASLRRAGMVYSQLAEMRVATEHYADDLWAACECFMRGQNYDEAIYLLHKYLDNESRRRNPQALVSLGRAYLALGKTDAALETFEKCVEYHPQDAESYRARLWAARTCREKGDAEKAEKILAGIIAGEEITPSSTVWQDALFDLGELEHERGKYAEAAGRLEEAVLRMPDSPRAVLGRYLIADSYRAKAGVESEKRRKILASGALVAPREHIVALLKSAQEQYQQVRDALDRRQSQGELYGPDREILRNCYMGVPDMFFEMEEYEKAVEQYALLIRRYQSRPLVLQAYLQTVRAQQRLGRMEDARRTLNRAKSVLERMPEDAEFGETTNMNKGQWAKLFDRMAAGENDLTQHVRSDNRYARV